ncbi:MAG: type III-A CRISPR-associated protein Cas10/Csm1 [Planctomycetaceae bacterium]|nr:type III-A CRISPR-associated protein Cas10/Csm1 [Planctomycetaceae bacterium]
MNTEWIVSPPHRRAYTIAAAGLLHDIGKLLEPAGVELSQQTRNLAQMFCPTDAATQKSTHQHVLYSSHAFEQINSNFGGLDRQEIHDIAMHHHRPSPGKLDQQLLTRADWTASGADRSYVATADEQQVNGLLSVMSTIAWPDSPPQTVTDKTWMPTARLNYDSELIPGDRQDRAEYKACSAALTDDFIKALSFDSESASQWILTTLTVLERFLHSIPASRYRKHQPDVTLFDHSRAVAAFGACLSVQYDTGSVDVHQLKGQYRLLSISAGGIQGFLFRSIPKLDSTFGESTDKGAAKQLRARSFLVSMLTTLAARRILDATGMPPVNVLLDAGGRTVVLLPATEEIDAVVRKTMEQLDTWIDSTMGGVLRLDQSLSDVLSDDDFRVGTFSGHYRLIDQRLSDARHRFPWSHLRAEEGWTETSWIHRAVANTEHVALPLDREPFLQALTDFGRRLPKCDLLQVIPAKADRGTRGLEAFGYRLLLQNIDDRRIDHPESVTYALRKFEQFSQLPAILTAAHVPVCTDSNLRRLSLVPASAMEEIGSRSSGDLLTFEELGHLSSDDEGRPIRHSMLGVLKADVDRLGMILGYGLRERASIGRFASLSRQLDTFFKGFLTTRLRQDFEFIYTVFAGGDDLFLIGPWYDIVRLTRRLHQWFEQLVSSSSNLTFSAGVVFAPAGIPVRHLADHGDEALAKAKNQGRNHITIGPVTMTWPDFEKAWLLHQQMVNATRSITGLNASMAYRLLQYARMGLGMIEGRGGVKNPLDMKWRSQLNYDVKRNFPDPRHASAEVNALRESLVAMTPADLESMHVAATLTLYVLRGED